MTLHPDLPFPSAQELESLTPEALAERLNGPGGAGLSGTLGARLGIRLTSAARERVVGQMPAAGNLQPAGRLHGGANLALAEELASWGSWLNIDPARQAAVGVDLSATHLRGVTGGVVTGEATLAYRGRTVLVWEVRLTDERGKPTSLARCTCHVISGGA